ncbi:MAG: sigma-70 family RNA polymerase sigma factor [Acetobacteraceae bacterium]|nr:sigma-70 family RNA polymerase sigma factor [Acetobacteraceae bacterium]
MITNVATLSNKRASSRVPAGRPQVAITAIPDRELIERIAAGNGLAMQALYARYNARIFRYALRLLGSRADAEDLVSDVFLDVWRRADTFEGRAQVSTWLIGIARNKAIDMRNSRSAEPWDEDVASAIEDTTANPEADVLARNRNGIIRACLTQLSPAHREIIDLVYYHGQSIDDIAKLTGVPHATVKTRMFYARKRLAAVLRERGITTAAA